MVAKELLPRLEGSGAGEKRLGRMIAIVGDAELDEGNVYEALIESFKHEVADSSNRGPGPCYRCHNYAMLPFGRLEHS